VHDGLLSVTAQLALLLGSMYADSGHHATARQYHQIAARLAADADDHTTLAIALRTMATHAHDLGHHTPAVSTSPNRPTGTRTAPRRPYAPTPESTWPSSTPTTTAMPPWPP